jgi:hypothetical protein
MHDGSMKIFPMHMECRDIPAPRAGHPHRTCGRAIL